MIVVAGEALFDVFASGATPTGLTLDARIGGSPFNIALGLARLQQPVGFFGALARGFLGDRLLAALRAEGVALEAVQRVDAPTTLSVVGLDAAGVPAYTFYGDRGADRQLEVADLPAHTRALQLGSYSLVVEPIANTLRTVVERERARRVIAYDPNVRLNVESDVERWRDALQWMVPRTHLVKVSEEDLGLLYPQASASMLAPQWLAQGVKLVVVTRGADGALAWSGEHHVAVPAAPSTVIDTVGAGDSFQAALLCWLAEHDALDVATLGTLGADGLEAALRFAADAAALTCTRRGADLPRRAELEPR